MPRPVTFPRTPQRLRVPFCALLGATLLNACIVQSPSDMIPDGAPPPDAALRGDGPTEADVEDAPLAADDARPHDAEVPDAARDTAETGPDAFEMRPDDRPAPRPDRDGDGIADADDPCPDVASRLPRDVDGDGAGDACDADDDGDGVLDVFDPCPWLADERGPADCADDRDADGRPDADDACPTVPDPGDGPCPGPVRPMPWSRATSALQADGETLIAGTRGGVLRLDANGVLLEQWTAADGLGPDVTSLARGPDGAIWVAHGLGLSVIRPDGLILRVGEDTARAPAKAVVVADDGVWFANDDGVWRASADLVERMGERAQGLFLDAEGAPWRVDLVTVERLHPPQAGVFGLGPVGLLEGGAAGAEPGTFWVMGTRGVARIRDGMIDWLYTTGDRVYAVVERAGQTYLATAGGIRRIDRDGRLLPAAPWVDDAAPPLSPGAARALAVDDEGRLWAGTDGGLLQLDGVLSAFDMLELPCVTAVARFDGLLWLGSVEGLRVIDARGTLSAVHEALGFEVGAIARVADTLWVGTEAGVTIFGPDQEVIDTLRAGVELPDAPVSDIVVRGDEIWIATDGAGIAVGAPGAWRMLNVADGLLYPEVFALADDGAFMWIATPLGAQAWDHAQQALLPPGHPRIAPVWDVAAAPGRPFVAGADHVYTRLPDGLWASFRRQVGGVPNAAGTDTARALAFDGENLWMLLDVSRRMEHGSLLRRSPDPAVRPTAETLWPLEALGVEQRPDVDLSWIGDELAITACGDRVERGGLWLLDGRGLVGLDTAPRRLPGGPDARLTRGPHGWPMIAGEGPGGPLLTLIERGALIASDVGDAPAAPTACDAVGDTLWCVFANGSLGRRFGNGQWNRSTPRLAGQPPLELRDVALSGPDDAWIATDRGLLHVDGPDVRLMQRAAGGLIADDVRAVHVDGVRVYAATSDGVSIYITATSRWFDVVVDRLPSGSTRALWTDGAERLWVATDAGLAVMAADGDPLAQGPGIDLLAGVAVSGVIGGDDGRVYAASAEGLYVLHDGDGRRLFGAAHGVPGLLDGRMVVDPEGDIWVGGSDGVARLDPRDR